MWTYEYWILYSMYTEPDYPDTDPGGLQEDLGRDFQFYRWRKFWAYPQALQKVSNGGNIAEKKSFVEITLECILLYKHFPDWFLPHYVLYEYINPFNV